VRISAYKTFDGSAGAILARRIRVWYIGTMRPSEYLKAFSEFFLDGAKIIFGSVVVGAFIPGTGGPISWLTFVIGTLATISFLVVSATITIRLTNTKL